MISIYHSDTTKGKEDLMPVESAINEPADVRVFEYPLNYDSIHGIVNADMTANNNSIIIDGKEIRAVYCKFYLLVPCF